MELNELTKPRLTDDRTYQQIKDVAEGHARAGRTPDIDQLRYIKLAEYEQVEGLFLDLSPHLEKWQVIACRYAMAEYIHKLQSENQKLKDFIRMVLKDIEKHLPEVKVDYKTYRGIDLRELLGECERADEEKAEEILPTDDVYSVKRWLETK